MRQTEENTPLMEETQTNFYQRCKEGAKEAYARFVKPVFEYNYSQLIEDTWKWIKDGLSAMIKSISDFFTDMLHSLDSFRKDLSSVKDYYDTNIKSFKQAAESAETFCRCVGSIALGNMQEKAPTGAKVEVDAAAGATHNM
tara:strand:- start:779 stop:1201 length:423 start_codon:yes stop_codon:yes gene_type:complete